MIAEMGRGRGVQKMKLRKPFRKKKEKEAIENRGKI